MANETVPTGNISGEHPINIADSPPRRRPPSLNDVVNQMNRTGINFRFPWDETVLALSFAVLVGLLSVSYDRVGGSLVPSKLFPSHPMIFHVLLVSEIIAVAASVIGIKIRRIHSKAGKYLVLSAFIALMVVASIIFWALLPAYIKWLPFLFFPGVLLVLIYAHFYEGEEHRE